MPFEVDFHQLVTHANHTRQRETQTAHTCWSGDLLDCSHKKSHTVPQVTSTPPAASLTESRARTRPPPSLLTAWGTPADRRARASHQSARPPRAHPWRAAGTRQG
eukprot:2248466-Prymnesium_polylepis.3